MTHGVVHGGEISISRQFEFLLSGPEISTCEYKLEILTKFRQLTKEVRNPTHFSGDAQQGPKGGYILTVTDFSTCRLAVSKEEALHH